MKKKSLITLCIIFVLFLVLFVIQTVDQKINSEDYQKIHKFGQQFKELMLENNNCTTNLEQVITKLFEDSSSNSDVSITALKSRASACYKRAEQFSNIPVPTIKNLKKREMMFKAKEEFSYTIEIYGDILSTFAEAKQSNQELDTKQLLNLLGDSTNTQKKLFITALEFYMTYSIRDILISRPFLLYSKLRLH